MFKVGTCVTSQLDVEMWLLLLVGSINISWVKWHLAIE